MIIVNVTVLIVVLEWSLVQSFSFVPAEEVPSTKNTLFDVKHAACAAVCETFKEGINMDELLKNKNIAFKWSWEPFFQKGPAQNPLSLPSFAMQSHTETQTSGPILHADSDGDLVLEPLTMAPEKHSAPSIMEHPGLQVAPSYPQTKAPSTLSDQMDFGFPGDLKAETPESTARDKDVPAEVYHVDSNVNKEETPAVQQLKSLFTNAAKLTENECDPLKNCCDAYPSTLCDQLKTDGHCDLWNLPSDVPSKYNPRMMCRKTCETCGSENELDD